MRAIAILALGSACQASGTFACDRDEQCSGGGVCEATGFCSFSDPTCPSGQRYDPYAGDGLNGQCVPNGATSDAGGDGPINALLPLHLAPADGVSGTAALTLTGTVMIDTTALTISGVTLPAGDAFDMRPQLGGGPDLAVLHVGALLVANAAMVQITGTRPFVIVAGGAVDIEGVVDAGAHGQQPGPGGSLSATGTGAGGPGVHAPTVSDSGGGGAGFGDVGAVGGDVSCTPVVAPGTAGVAVGTATVTMLVGGSGGGLGSGSVCTLNPGGAGGGALQISSVTGIEIGTPGQLIAGGGGGSGGTDCGNQDGNSGAGGGAGGAIVLQAPAITNAGVVAANGGGGGGSGTGGGGAGMPGQDAQLATAANGGAGVGGSGANGGAGGAGSVAAIAGVIVTCGNNGGGGGGAVGRIAASTGYASSGVTSPDPDTSLPQ